MGSRPGDENRLCRSRRGVLTALGTAALGPLGGCLGSDSEQTQAATPTTEQTPQAEQVRVVARGRSGRLFKRLMRDYVERETGITVTVEFQTYEELFDTIDTLFSNEGTEYDILYMDDPWFPRFAPHLAPIREWFPDTVPEDAIIDQCLDIATWPTPGAPTIPEARDLEQRLRGQVVLGNTQLFAYNQSHYDAVGRQSPDTWQEAFEIGQHVTETLDGTAGYAIRGKSGNPIMANFFSVGFSIAGAMFDENWRYAWNDEQGTEAIRFFTADLASISPSDTASFTSGAVVASLGDGDVTQGLVWPAAAAQLLDPDETAEYANIEFAPVPKGQRRAPQQGNWIAGINRYVSKSKKRAAGAVLQSFISADAQDRYVELGGIPFRHDTFQTNIDAEPFFDALYESLQTAQWRPRTPLWSEIEATQGEYLHNALTEMMTPETVASQSQTDIESLLADNNYYA